MVVGVVALVALVALTVLECLCARQNLMAVGLELRELTNKRTLCLYL